MAYLLQGLALGFSAASSPGPFQAFLLAQALQNGWRRAWPAAFAPLLSDGPIVLLVLLALAVIPDWLVDGLRLAGGLFLFYLAWGAAQALRQPPGQPSEPSAVRQGLIKAALTNALSPGPWIFWSTVVGPAFLSGWRASAASGLAFLAAFYAAMVAVLLALIGVFSAAARLGPRVVRAIQAFSVVLLAGFGVYQLWMGVSGLT